VGMGMAKLDYTAMLIFYAIRGFGYPLFAYSFMVWITYKAPKDKLSAAVGWFWFVFTGGLNVLGAYYSSWALERFGYDNTLWSSILWVLVGAFFALIINKDKFETKVQANSRSAELINGLTIVKKEPKVLLGGIVRVINTTAQFGFADAEDVDVVHHRVLHGGLDRRVDVLGGHPDDGGVQRVHHLAGGVGEGVGHRDQVAAGDPAHRGELHVDGEFITGDDRPVLFEDLFGLHVGVVTDDHRLEHLPVAGHARCRGERQRRHQIGIAQLSCRGDVPVGRVVVLHRAGVLAELLAAHQIGVVHLVPVADPGFERR